MYNIHTQKSLLKIGVHCEVPTIHLKQRDDIHSCKLLHIHVHATKDKHS